MAAARRSSKSIAEAEGYGHLDDRDLAHLTAGRIRQLEGELYGHRMFLDEEAADPHSAEADVETVQEKVQSLEARIPVLRERHAELVAAIKAASPPPEDG